MNVFHYALLAALVTLPAGAALADDAKPVPTPNPAEAAFVKRIQGDLTKRFSTTADAERGGYLRYGNEDDTGAISYANRQWTSNDAAHPSQLWYDVNGRLLGADYSVLQADSPQAPHLWGVDPSRWIKFGAHIHYGLIQPDGTIKYGGMGGKKYTAVGGDPANPDAAGLVKAGVVKDPSQVKFSFAFPAIWDLVVWVLPNPAGAFAEKNPNVTPTKNAKGMD